MSTTDDLLKALEKKIEILSESNVLLSIKIDELENDVKESKAINKERIQDNKRLKEINNDLRITNAMLGSPEHKRLMKSRINQIIKEVDGCIAAVKQTTL